MAWEVGSGLTISAILLVVIVTAAMLIWVERRLLGFWQDRLGEVAADTRAADMVRAAKGADKKLITAVRVFDVFAGGSLPEGMKSVALEVTLQPRDKTLTDAEIEAVAEKVTAAVEKASGGKLRG